MNWLVKKIPSRTSAPALIAATGIASLAPQSGFIYTANERDASISEIRMDTRGDGDLL